MPSTVVRFVLRGMSGDIRVRLEPNPNPRDWIGAAARLASGVEWDQTWMGNFPACSAVIDHPSVGYEAMCGWVQLVRSSDSVPEMFEMDPTPITAGLDVPYCWFGTKPTLFDGPSRDSHEDLDWRARSFLCASPAIMSRTVVPVAAFEWGFDIRNGSVAISGPTEIPLSTWDEHTDYMRRCHPLWTFEPATAHDQVAGGPAGKR